jgi:hypothetical protein
MVLLSTVTIDLGAGTAILNCQSDGSLCENITYDNSLQTITFVERGELFIPSLDYIQLSEQFKILETAIQFNFFPNQFATQPWNQVVTDNTLETGSGQWNLTMSSVVLDPLVIEYSAILSLNQVQLHKRGNPKTIEFPEWIACLERLKSYQVQLRNYFSI